MIVVVVVIFNKLKGVKQTIRREDLVASALTKKSRDSVRLLRKGCCCRRKRLYRLHAGRAR
jgi:hypothetical protein